MLQIGDTVYTYVVNGTAFTPIDGRVLDIRPTDDYPRNFKAVLEMNIPYEDGFWATKVSGTYTPGETRTEGGCEYVSIRDTVKRACRMNCYVFTDRIFNLQCCLRLSAMEASNASHACKKVLDELRSLGEEPPEDVSEVMARSETFQAGVRI